MAGSSHTLTSTRVPGYEVNVIGEFLTAIVGDDANGTVPTLTLDFPRDVELLQIETNPGSTGPTADWDITLLDSDGADVLDGSGLNRHTSSTLVDPIIWASTSLHPVIKAGTYTLTVANTSVNDATATIAIRFRNL